MSRDSVSESLFGLLIDQGADGHAIGCTEFDLVNHARFGFHVIDLTMPSSDSHFRSLIRIHADFPEVVPNLFFKFRDPASTVGERARIFFFQFMSCLLYTSDAADE